MDKVARRGAHTSASERHLKVNIRRDNFHLHALLALALAGGTACGGGAVDSAASAVMVAVYPPDVQASPLGSVQLAAVVTGTANTAVQWLVAEAAGGTVDGTGLYSAPATFGTYHVTAKSVADPSVTGTATVSVSPAPPACASAPLRTTGTVYYYCDCTDADVAAGTCVRGNDANNNANSPSTPRQTLPNAISRINSMAAGDTVAFCRGGSWSVAGGGYGISNSACSGASDSTWCEIREYTRPGRTSADARPRFNVAAGASLLSVNGNRGYRFWNLDVQMVVTDNSSYAMTVASSVRDLDVCNVNFAGGRCDIYLLNPGVAQTGNFNVQIRNSQFATTMFTAVLGGSPGMTLDSNYFENNGLGGQMFQHTIYLGGAAYDYAPGMKVTNNDAVADARCGGPMFVFHGVASDLVVDNNRVSANSTNPGCTAVEFSGSAATWAEFDRALVRGNRVTANIPTALQVSLCVNCTVSDNIVVGSLRLGGTGCSSTAACTSGMLVQNNTVYNSIFDTGSGTGYMLDNNAVWTSGSSCWSGGGTFVRNTNSYCRTSGGAAVGTVFVDAPNGDFRPAQGGPLVGTGNPTYFAPTAIGSVQWSPTDSGTVRTSPINIGAY